MIDLAIDHIVEQLNAYINLRTGIAQRVVQGSLLEQSGDINASAIDKVVLSLVNVEEDRIARSVETMQRQADGRYHKVKPEIRINLYLLYIANLNDYSEALKSISHVINFFQQTNYFDYADIDGAAGAAGRIVFELYSLSFEQLNHLWGALGVKYLPSVIYKARVATILDDQIEATLPPVVAVDIGT